MTVYDFDTVVDRRGTNCLKYDQAEQRGYRKDILPLWIADMDFPTAPEITAAFEERLKHPVFGYGRLRDDWFDAYISLWKRRHHVEIKRESLLFCAGVVPGINSIIRHFTSPGDEIIMLTPTYNHFYYCIEGAGRKVLEVELDYSGYKYSVNFERLEIAVKNSDSMLMIVCNPQNPTGTVWSREDLKK